MFPISTIAYAAHTLTMSNLTIADFDNPQVASATNPSAFGHHHGPIPNPNPDWVTPARAAAAAAAAVTGGRPPAVTVQDNANPPNAASVLSSVNTMVCDIAVNGTQMCGRVFTAQPSYRRHVRNEHSGALTNPTTNNTPVGELIAGENSLKLFVLSGAWRDARYLHEPGRGPSGSRISEYADACTLFAATDEAFAARFGRQFHREFNSGPKGSRRPKASIYEARARLPLGVLPSTGSKRKRGPTPPSDHEESPSPSTHRQSEGRNATGGRRRGGGKSSGTPIGDGTRRSSRLSYHSEL